METEGENAYEVLDLVQGEAWDEIEVLKKEGKDFRDENDESRELRDWFLGMMLECRDSAGVVCKWSERKMIRVV